jgi:hypothetical protein
MHLRTARLLRRRFPSASRTTRTFAIIISWRRPSLSLQKLIAAAVFLSLDLRSGKHQQDNTANLHRVMSCKHPQLAAPPASQHTTTMVHSSDYIESQHLGKHQRHSAADTFARPPHSDDNINKLYTYSTPSTKWPAEHSKRSFTHSIYI